MRSDVLGLRFAVISFMVAAFLPFNEHTYVDFIKWAVAFVGLGIYFWLHFADEGDLNSVFAVISFIIAAFLPFNEHIYLDFTDRQIVTLKHYAWFEISKRCRPLADFSHIVVRHLCQPGEGEDTYTGSVGLKPVDGRAVLEVKSFPTTRDEVPRTAYEFARKLQEMTGLPGAAEPIACVWCGTTIPGDATTCQKCGKFQEADVRRARLWLDIIKGR